MKKLRTQQLTQVFQRQEQLMSRSSVLRKGQAFFNALSELYPEVAEEVRHSRWDPFHNDNLLEGCIEILSQRIDNLYKLTDEFD